MTSWLSVQNVPCLCVVAVLCVVLLSGLAGQAAEIDRGVEPIKYEKGKLGWPIKLPDGRLMAIHTVGKKFEQRITDTETIEKAYARYSTDNGRTWSDPELLFEYPKSGGAYFVNPPLCDRDGVIHLFGHHYFSFPWGRSDLPAKSPVRSIT